MRWNDEGIVVWRSAFGEGSMTVSVLTREHGLHAGLVRCGRGGGSSRNDLQPGNLLDVQWSGRLSEHLGNYTVQVKKAYASYVMQGRGVLLALNSVVSLLRFALPERQPMPLLYGRTHALLQLLANEAEDGGSHRSSSYWAQAYCLWELALLEELGYGLDMGSCALGGDVGDLGYVSPKTGRAASVGKAFGYRDKLLRLPNFLMGGLCDDVGGVDLLGALELTGFFIGSRILEPVGREFPYERMRLLETFSAI